MIVSISDLLRRLDVVEKDVEDPGPLRHRDDPPRHLGRTTTGPRRWPAGLLGKWGDAGYGEARFVGRVLDLERPRALDPAAGDVGALTVDCLHTAPNQNVVLPALKLNLFNVKFCRGDIVAGRVRVQASPTSCSRWPARSCSRSRNFWTLPDGVRGNSRDGSDRLRPLLLGEMAGGEVLAHLLQGRRSRCLLACARWRRPLAEASIGFGDHGDLGMASMPKRSSSTSWAEMFSPPRMMMSEMRSVIVR